MMARCAGGVKASSMGKHLSIPTRHDEIVSASIVLPSPSVAVEKSTLKQVQGDDAALVG